MTKELDNQKHSIEDLDQESEHLGMGGFLAAEANEESYRKRMQRKKEVQGTRIQKRNLKKGLIIVFTGKGKGKTTAALGMALRTLGHNKKVAIVQFIKGGWKPGESRALKVFKDQLKWHAFGAGFTWETQDRIEDKKLTREAWDQASSYLLDDEYHLVILDEINIAIKLGYLSLEEVLNVIEKRPKFSHVVLTGRSAKEKLIQKADLVSEMNLIKHPFREQGVKAQKGIEF